jgi:tetratricopeptide (TPR) repeat protein
MTSLLNAFRSAIAYSSAGTLRSRGEYIAAISKIEDAKRLAGASLRKPSLLNYYMRAADIYYKAGDSEKAIQDVHNAIDSIRHYRSLSDMDRCYLLDYCDLFVADIQNLDSDVVLRTSIDNYSKVSKRFKKDYPWRFP